MEAECPRHNLPFGHPTTTSSGWWVTRCAHMDDMFVVELHHTAGAVFLDYVQDGAHDVVVITAHSWSRTRPPEQTEVDGLWSDLTEAMRAGRPPDDVVPTVGGKPITMTGGPLGHSGR